MSPCRQVRASSCSQSQASAFQRNFELPQGDPICRSKNWGWLVGTPAPYSRNQGFDYMCMPINQAQLAVWGSSHFSPQSLQTTLLTILQLHPPPSQPVTHKYPSVRNIRGSHGSEYELQHKEAWHCIFWKTSVSEKPEASVCIKPEDGGSRFFRNAGNHLVKMHDVKSKKIVLILPIHSL